MLSEIEENQDHNVIIAGHYPPASQGRRGGKFPVRDHFTPPFYGSFRISFRQNIGTPDELTNRRFRAYVNKLNSYNSQFEGLLFVGAQDRSQQLLGFGRNHIINAGAADDGKWVADHQPARHTSREAGITEVTFEQDGSVIYRYFLARDGRVDRTENLYYAPCAVGADTTYVNPAFPPCPFGGMEESTAAAPVDSVTAAAGPQYVRGKIGRLFLGAHYRDVWATPVRYPVLDLNTDTLDLIPDRQAGGRGETALKLLAKNRQTYLFRSVDKDPARTFNYELQNTLVGDAVRDQTSATHPYGALIVAPLLDRLDILHTTPSVYQLATSRQLANYNPLFGNLLGKLLVLPRGRDTLTGRPGTFGSDKILKTFELFRERYDDQEVLIDDDEFLRARLFDLLIGDWAKQEENWLWAQYGTEGDVDEVARIRPIPMDRDNVFSRFDGILPWLATKGVSHLENFSGKTPDAGGLTERSRYMDRLLLSSLSRSHFREQAQLLRAALPDSVLRAAINRTPQPADRKDVARYTEAHDELYEMLRKRRDALLEVADDFYELNARTVDVVGTNDEEAFLLEAFDDGSLRVTSTDVKGKSAGKVLYDRTFLPGETNEVRIYGLGDDDRFRTVGPVGKRIRVRIVGGEGEDEYVDADGRAGKTQVYDKTVAGNTRNIGLEFRRDWRQELYYYDRTAFTENKTGPVASLGFSSYSGVQARFGLQHLRTNFRRRELSKRYRLFVEAGALGNLAVEASAEFGQVIRYADIVVSSRAGFPEFYNFFFGLGNNSELVPNTERNDFNLVRLNHFDAQLGLRRRYADNSYFNLWFGYQNNKTTDRENTILDREERFYGDGNFEYAFIRPEFVLDLRDHPRFPSKGVLLEASHKQAYGREGAENFGVTKVAAEIHVSTRRFPVGVSFRTGWAASTGRPPFYERPSIGRANGLRGFQRNRFTGDGYFFYNTEIRIPLARVRSRLLPFAFGIRGFYDRGRIIQNDDGPNGFKSAYGGGVYLVPPSKRFTLSALLGWSEEESALISVGFGTAF